MLTSGVTRVVDASGIASGTGIPRPAATISASFIDALRSDASIRSRIAGTLTFESSKRNAAAMCSFSTSVWLSKKSVACA